MVWGLYFCKSAAGEACLQITVLMVNHHLQLDSTIPSQCQHWTQTTTHFQSGLLFSSFCNCWHVLSSAENNRLGFFFSYCIFKQMKCKLTYHNSFIYFLLIFLTPRRPFNLIWSYSRHRSCLPKMSGFYQATTILSAYPFKSERAASEAKF